MGVARNAPSATTLGTQMSMGELSNAFAMMGPRKSVHDMNMLVRPGPDDEICTDVCFCRLFVCPFQVDVSTDLGVNRHWASLLLRRTCFGGANSDVDVLIYRICCCGGGACQCRSCVVAVLRSASLAQRMLRWRSCRRRQRQWAAVCGSSHTASSERGGLGWVEAGGTGRHDAKDRGLGSGQLWGRWLGGGVAGL